MEAKVYNQEGKEAGKINLPEELFGLKWNADLIHQVVAAMQGNARTPVAHAKDRSAVRGGGKKPWRQKGTGRARHGSTRSPIWVGGGVTHGPLKERDYSRKINKKMKAKALFTVLSRKWRDGEVVLVDSLDLGAGKTKLAATAIKKLAGSTNKTKMTYKRGNRLLVSLPAGDEAANRSFRNLKSVLVKPVAELNPMDVLNYRYLLITDPEKSLAVLSQRRK